MNRDFGHGQEPMFNLPSVIVVFIFVSVAVFVGQKYYLVESGAENFFLTFCFTPVRYVAGVIMPGGAGAEVWSPFTYVFINTSLSDLVFEMLWMMAFGSALAFRFGPFRFALFSLVAAVIGAAVFWLLSGDPQTVLIGPSFMISAQLGGAVRFVYQSGFSDMMNGDDNRWHVKALGIIEMWSNEKVLRLFGFIFIANALFAFVFGSNGGLSVTILMNVIGYISGILLFSIFDRASVNQIV
jgi:membrane associated rhomboid family serine protease